jgi:ABC-type sulfate transport system permease subunit
MFLRHNNNVTAVSHPCHSPSVTSPPTLVGVSVTWLTKRNFSFEAQIFLRCLSEIPLGVFEVIAGAWR